MRNFLLAIICLAVVVGSANGTPEKYQSGIPALDVFLKAKNVSHDQIVVGITGFYGQTQPRQWLILTKEKNSPDQMHEFVITDGVVEGRRRMRKLPNQDIPTIPIERNRLKIDSDRVFDVAESLANIQKVGYDSVHYQLRCRDANNEPVWVVNLLDPIGRSIGVHYVSAESGELLRSVWHKLKATNSMTKSADGKTENLLYGAKVKEVSVSGNVSPRIRPINRVISPAAVK